MDNGYLAGWLETTKTTWGYCLNDKRVLKTHVDALLEGHEVKIEYSGLQTFAHLYLADGTYVCTAFSSVIDPAQYDQGRGADAAISKVRSQAVDKLFELEGWRLRNHS